MSRGNESAYPVLGGLSARGMQDLDEFKAYSEGGLTKREYFAAMALHGICTTAPGDYKSGPCNDAVVKRAVALADLLIKELSRGEG